MGNHPLWCRVPRPSSEREAVTSAVIPILLAERSLLTVRIAGVGDRRHLIDALRRPCPACHLVAQVESGDQLVFGVNRDLRV